MSPSRWHIIVKDINNRFYYKCNTIDDINGLFITGHVGEVWEICKSPGIGKFDFVVANTCIWEDGYEKQILSELMHANDKTLYCGSEASGIIGNADLLCERQMNWKIKGCLAFLRRNQNEYFLKIGKKGL